MVAQNVFFGIFAVIMVFSAIRVVTTRNVVHAALWLVLVLAGAAAQYILLAAEFLAASQVLVYIGAIVVLFLFGTMLTRAQIGGEREATGRNWWTGALVALLLLGTLGYVLVDAFGDEELPADVTIRTANAARISDSFMGPYVLPFLALGVLLTAALIGAVVLARRD